MKQYITFTLLTAVFLFSFSFAYAQEDPATGVRQARPSLIKERVDSVRSRTRNKSATSNEVDAKRVETRNLIRDKRSGNRKKRIEVKERVTDKRADVRSNLKDEREGLRDKKSDLKSELRDKRSDVRGNLKDKRENLKDRRKDARERLAEKKEERIKKLNERAQKRISAYVKRITKRLNAALDRLEKIAGRVESRIEKLEERFADRNLDLSEAKVLLDVTESEIAKARESVSSIEGALSGVLNTDNPKESFTSVRELIKNAVDSIKSAHRALVEAIKAVKAGVGTPSSNGTAGVEDNNQ